MLSVVDEKKFFKIFLYASVASLAMHAGIFLLVVRLGKTWGWIPLNESLFEVSIVSLMEKPGEKELADHPLDLKTDTIQNKMVHSHKKPKQPQPSVITDKAPENIPAEPMMNHLPGDAPSRQTDMAMIPDASVPSQGNISDTVADHHGSGMGEMNMSSEGGGQGSFGTKMNYLDMVRMKIEHQKKYPDAAQQRNIEGQVTVEFEISLDGRITEPSVSKSSGHSALDLAAIDAVKKASPFQSPPRQFFTDAIHINLPIRFELVR
jgi:TonB family protein